MIISFIEASDVQLEKAHSLIVVTPSGRLIEASEVQLQKARARAQEVPPAGQPAGGRTSGQQQGKKRGKRKGHARVPEWGNVQPEQAEARLARPSRAFETGPHVLGPPGRAPRRGGGTLR